MGWFLKSLLPPIAKGMAMAIPKTKEEAIQKVQEYDLIYAHLGYLYTILPNDPQSCLGDLSKTRASHVVDGFIGSIMQSNKFSYPHRINVYGNLYCGFSSSYPLPSIGYPSMPNNYPNPPVDPSRFRSQVGNNTTYLGHHAHHHMHCYTYTSSSCSGVAMNPYYPFPSPPPTTLVPPITVPQPPFNVGQPAPPLQS